MIGPSLDGVNKEFANKLNHNTRHLLFKSEYENGLFTKTLNRDSSIDGKPIYLLATILLQKSACSVEDYRNVVAKNLPRAIKYCDEYLYEKTKAGVQCEIGIVTDQKDHTKFEIHKLQCPGFEPEN